MYIDILPSHLQYSIYGTQHAQQVFFSLQYKAEVDQYLRQVEAEGNAEQMYGKGTELVFPEPAFVVKTINEGSGQRIYINVCHSDKVRGGGMHSCSMSHSASAKRYCAVRQEASIPLVRQCMPVSGKVKLQALTALAKGAHRE